MKNILRILLLAGIAGAVLPAASRASDEFILNDKIAGFVPREGVFHLLESSAPAKDPVLFVWDTDYGPDWFKPYPGTDAAYKDFSGWVRAHIDPDARALLKHNRKIFKKKGWSTKKYDLILNGQVGRIRPMNRFEAELFLLQLDLFGKPYTGEILAYVLRKGDKLRVYGYATALQTIRPHRLSDKLETDLADKWEFYANLHNHPFMFSDKNSSTGELVLSGDDGDVPFGLAQVENLGLQRVWLTNGFDTIEISTHDLSVLGGIPGR